MSTKWQEYDCPITGIDFDINEPNLVVRGQVFHCSGCWGTHTAGVDVDINEYTENPDGTLSYGGIEIE